MLRSMLVVARKELRDVVRDRRSLFSGLLYGLWGPLVMTLALTALARQGDTERLPTLVVHGASLAPSLVAFLTDHRVAVHEADGELRDRIRDRELTVALVVSEDYPQRIEAARPARVTLLFDGSWSSSRQHADRARAILAEYAKGIADTRLILRGVGPSAVLPLEVAENDLSTPSSRAATALATLPLFVLLAAFVGGMGIAADLTAGERERGTLEFLLTLPSPRGALIAGKWLVAALASVATVTLTLIVTRAVLQLPRIQSIDVPVGLSAGEALLIWLVLAPLALMVAALQVLIALFARSYKEAHTQLSLLMFVPMIPGFLFAFGSIRPQDWMSWVPMIGQHVLLTTLVEGRRWDSGDVAAVTAVTVVAMALALGAASRLLEQEWIVRRAAG
jgi:sodium transport system permease protein